MDQRIIFIQFIFSEWYDAWLKSVPLNQMAIEGANMLRSCIIIFCFTVTPCMAVNEKAQKIAPIHSDHDHHKYQMGLTVDVDQNVTTPEKAQVHYSLSLETEADLKISQIREDQSADLLITLNKPRLQFSVTNSENENDLFNLTYDSSKENEPPLPPFQYITPVAKCLDGAEFTITVDTNGRISDLKSLKSFRRKLDKELDSSFPQEMKEQLCSTIESQATLVGMKYFTSYLPDHEVKLGDKWTGESTLLGLGDQQTWTLSELGENNLQVKKAYTVTKEQMERLVGNGIFKDAEAKVLESVHVDKQSFVVLSNQINASTKAHQKMPLPDGRDLDATYEVKAQLSLSKLQD